MLLQLSDVTSSFEGLQHEKHILEEQLQRLRGEVVSGRLTCRLTGITVGSLEELERIQRLEQDRQEALERLASSQRGFDCKTKEWEFERKQHEVSRDLCDLLHAFRIPRRLPEHVHLVAWHPTISFSFHFCSFQLFFQDFNSQLLFLFSGLEAICPLSCKMTQAEKRPEISLEL